MTGCSDMNFPVPPSSSPTYSQLQNRSELPAPTSQYVASPQYFGSVPPSISLEVPKAPGLHYSQNNANFLDENHNFSNLVFHSPPVQSVSEHTSPRTPVSDGEKKPRKSGSPAKKAKQMRRLLAYQDKLVLKGLPKSRLQNELELMSITLAQELGIIPIPPTPVQDSRKMSVSTAPSRTSIPPAQEHEIGLSLIPSTQEQDLGRMGISAASTMPGQNRDFPPFAYSRGHVDGELSGFCWGCWKYGYFRPVGATGQVFCLSCGGYGYLKFMEVIVLY